MQFSMSALSMNPIFDAKSSLRKEWGIFLIHPQSSIQNAAKEHVVTLFIRPINYIDSCVAQMHPLHVA